MRTTHNLDFVSKLREPHLTIYEIGACNGLRISDVISLKKKILVIEKPTIREQKTGKAKRLYIPVKTRQKMLEFAEKSKNDFIFFSHSKSGHISRQAVWKAFKKAGIKADVKVNIGTHTMRKNYSHKYFSKDKNIAKLQKRLNHCRADETALYLI